MQLIRKAVHSIRSLPSQARFYQSKAKFKGFSGPVGSGKTYALCCAALQAARRNQGCPGLIGGPTYRHLSEVTIPALVEILEQQHIPFRLWHGGQPRLYLERDKVLIIFRSMENPDGLDRRRFEVARRRPALAV